MAKFGSRRWFSQLSDDDYILLLTHLQDETKRIFSRSPLYYNFQNSSSRERLIASLGALKIIDRSIKSNERFIWKVVFRKIPSWLAIIEPYGWSKTANIAISSRVDDKTIQLAEAVNEMKNRHLHQKSGGKKKYNPYTTLVLESAKPQLTLTDGKKKVRTEAHVRKLTPAEFAAKFPETHKKVLAVTALTEVADTLNLTVEDQYFLEQVTTVHLPHVLDASEELKNADTMQKAVLEENFAQQLELLQSKVEKIVAETTARTVDAVKAQTDFLTKTLTEKEDA